MKNTYTFVVLLVCSCIVLSCNTSADTLFMSLSPSETGIDFTNKVENNDTMNYFKYRNFYNGAGVAIGDINNDGLPDVYVVSNQGPNKLYLNKGNLQFEDITEKAGVGGTKKFSTGATMADVNGDGWLDIYVCNSGEGDDRANELFINNGTPLGVTFAEKASQYGLDDKGYSTHAAFFDYDHDGDLDMFLLENSSFEVNKINNQNIRHIRDPLAGQKLFRNDAPKGFTDVSEEAGIYGSLIGFGLGITIGDVNNDNWPDIFISNDFFERDYLYINQKNGKFVEASKEWMGHESLSSMGADIADINNDENLDIFVTDMLPGNDKRYKTTTTFEDYNVQNIKLQNDFYYQYNHNALHLNNGNNTMSEVACLAGVHATDWSWGALIFDMDNDGQKDIFVANGIYKNVTDQDFVQFLNEEETMRPYQTGEKKFSYKEFNDIVQVVPIPNYAFKNESNGSSLKFTNKATEWGFGAPSMSNGSAYSDLDNDGDLDLIVNNLNEPLSVFKNQSVEKNKTNFLKIKLQGVSKNTHGIGARIKLYAGGVTQTLEQMPNRGFESSSDHVLLFGLGQISKIDSVSVLWPNDKKQVIKNVKINNTLTLKNIDATINWQPEAAPKQLIFSDVTAATGMTYQHLETQFIDYDRDPLLKQMYSREGPALAIGDINGDGLEDAFVGGAARGKKAIFVQQANGKFTEKPQMTFIQDEISEATDAVFFDADADKDLDLLVVTGSNEYFIGFEGMNDLLYLNDGKGNFTKDSRFPKIPESGSSVAVSDFDKDGDLDAFVGGRLVPGKYGISPKSQLYVNDGKGIFTENIGKFMPQNTSLGMVTDAVWADVDGDKYEDLAITQDWGTIEVFKNQKGKIIQNPTANTQNLSGWWNRIYASDLDKDGDIDFLVGNMGSNTRLRPTQTEPVALFVHDFDNNGIIDQIINCPDETGKPYPFVLKGDLQKRIPSIKKQFLKHADYAEKSLDDIFTKDVVSKALVRNVNEVQTGILWNNGKGIFTFAALPIEAQMSPVYGIEVYDFDNNGTLDILLTGNNYDVLPELGRYDSSHGLLFAGTGKQNFITVANKKTGLFVKGQVRNMHKIKIGKQGSYFIIAKNNDALQIIKM
jgi:enediyne biosynthesis protein E4